MQSIVKFTDQFTWQRSITFCAQSFNEWVRSVLPCVAELKPKRGHGIDGAQGQEIGKYIFYARVLPKYTDLEIYRGRRVGGIRFNGDVTIPILADKNYRPWMSLTPNEVLTQKRMISRAKGNVGMAGLGLGWAARKTLSRDSVTKLTVAEKTSELIDYFGKPLKEEFGDRIEFVNSCAYEVDWTAFDVSLWDIWEQYNDAPYDRRFQEIKKEIHKAGKVCCEWATYSGAA
jgi:hypothetical protein